MTPLRKIDLNADLGEGCGDDDALMAIVSSVNIACGGHAGNASTMDDAIRKAKDRGLAIGAHPAFPDKTGFGRQVMDIPSDQLERSLREQVETFMELTVRRGARTRHVKPHGALYNLANADRSMADLVCRILPKNEAIRLVGLPGSRLERASATAGIGYISEGFADRAYLETGALADRGRAGAIIEHDSLRAEQAIALASGGQIKSLNGGSLRLEVRTICLHGDTEGAAVSARTIRAELERRGFQIEPPR